jgi:hypothetical protein
MNTLLCILIVTLYSVNGYQFSQTDPDEYMKTIVPEMANAFIESLTTIDCKNHPITDLVIKNIVSSHNDPILFKENVDKTIKKVLKDTNNFSRSFSERIMENINTDPLMKNIGTVFIQVLKDIDDKCNNTCYDQINKILPIILDENQELIYEIYHELPLIINAYVFHDEFNLVQIELYKIFIQSQIKALSGTTDIFKIFRTFYSTLLREIDTSDIIVDYTKYVIINIINYLEFDRKLHKIYNILQDVHTRL